jgi:ankyrin repeat protein
MTKLLLDLNLSQTKDIYSQTPLFYSAKLGNISVSKLLIENGAGIQDVDSYLQTPIFYSARYIILI